MKNIIKLKTIRRIAGIIAIATVIGFSFTACDDGSGGNEGGGGGGGNTHTHNYGNWTVTTQATCTDAAEETRTCDCGQKETRAGTAALGHNYGNWTETTAPTYTTEGVETGTCTHDATHTTTRVYAPRIPFAAVASLGTWLADQETNNPAAPYTLKLDVNNISTLRTTLGGATDNGKYVYLDLSDSTMTTIPAYTFGTNTTGYTAALVGITLPNTVTTIGERAFSYCAGLASVTIPNSVTTIEEGAFYLCTSLTSVTIPNSITRIENSAFAICFDLASVTIPNSVTSIGVYAFYNCRSLTSVTFQGTITSTNLHTDAFANLGDLRDKYLAGGIGTYTTTAPVSWTSVWTKQP
jgi:hypothetical protein